MKLKTRLIIAFLTVITIPIVLSVTMVWCLSQYQINTIEKTYGITGTTMESLTNSLQMLSRVTEKPYHELSEIARTEPQKMEDATCLDDLNRKMEEKNAYLIVRKEKTIIYVGTDSEKVADVIKRLPDYGESDSK